MPLLSSRRLAALSAAALLLLGACNAPTASTPKAAASDPLAALALDGSQQAVVDLDRAIAAAGNDPAKLAPLATRLIALLGHSATSDAGRQAIAERLGEFPASVLATADGKKIFAALLADEKQVEFARLSLERVPGAEIDALFLDALKSHVRLPLVQAAGQRRLAAAVPLLAPSLAADAPLRLAAAKALAQIATADALAALRAAPEADASEIVSARLAAATRQKASEAARELAALADTPAVAAHQRAAALRSLLSLQPDAAPGRIVAALSGTEAILKPVVIEAVATLPASGLARVLAAQLASFDPATQSAVIAALGRRADPEATRAVALAASHADASVRAAALVALGRLPGTSDTASLLADVAAGADPADAKLARQSLARLSGSGVADAILAGARSTAKPVAVRVALLDSLAPRYATESVPALLQLRTDPDAAVRAAALGSLAELAPFSAQAAILDWAVAATDSAEQGRALRALASVSLRSPDAANRSRAVVAAIDGASPAVAARLAPVLPRLGDAGSAACAARLALSDDRALAATALAALTRWPDAAGLQPLVEAASRAPVDASRAAAAQGALRFIEQTRTLPSATVAAAVAAVVEASHDAALRLALVRLLSRCSDDSAVALAEKLQRDSALAAEAADSLLAIRSNRAGPPAVRSLNGTWQIENLLDGNPRKRWAAQASLGMWVEIDFHSPRAFHRLTLDQANFADDFAGGVEAIVTDDPAKLGPAAASVLGQPVKTVLDLPDGTRGRYLILRINKERDGAYWSIGELYID